MKHYTELELIEDQYVPDADVAAHASECQACAGRRARVARTLEQSRAEFDRRMAAKPEGFWSSQRQAILQRARQRREGGPRRTEILRWALAAGLLLVVGGGIYVDALRDRPADRPARTASAAASADPIVIPLPTADPWASEELDGWGDAVAWESWIEPDQGGAS